MKLGTQILMADGREGTVVYNSLIGVGVVWGLHDPDPADFKGTHGNTSALLGGGPAHVPEGFRWEPEALLRDPWNGCESSGWPAENCVGDEYEITRLGLVSP